MNGELSAESLVSSQLIRTPDQRVRVFVSSSIGELAEERTAARDAIAQLHLTPVLFESGARPYPPRELYRAYLEQSDIFIGIYWQKYGRVVPGMKISGLEDEYELAAQKPKLIYIKLPAQSREEELQKLVDRIRADGVGSYQKFNTVEELRERIGNDLALLLTERFTASQEKRPRPGIAQLPLPRSRLVDRENERLQVKALLSRDDIGLVTLTGPPGVGKTRLALQAAADMASQFEDGTVFISLALIRDPTLVAPTLARSLGISQNTNESIEEQLLEYLQPRRMLLVLDNVEQVISMAPLITRALQAARGMKLVVTSREMLRLSDEQVVTVPPLGLPNSPPTVAPENNAEFPALALFVQRAQEARPEFRLTNENRGTIIKICQHLDGLPLALELAAAVLTLLSPDALLTRLEQSLPLPTLGIRDLPERQQTLRKTIAWSYELLKENEKRLFRRLSVFVGGFTLEEVRAVCVFETTEHGPPLTEEGDELENLAHLLDMSLVQSQPDMGGEPRFTMLGTIRDFALDHLHLGGEEPTLKQRHADYFLRLSEQAERAMFGPEREIWMERLDEEEDNFRAALSYAKSNQNTLKIGLRLGRALGCYWVLSGNVREGRTWTEGMLELTQRTDRSPERGKALQGAGWLAWHQGDYVTATRFIEEGLPILEEVGDLRDQGYAKMWLGLVRMAQRDSASARQLLRDSYRVFTNLKDERNQAFALYNLGMAAYFSGDRSEAREDYEAALRLFNKIRDAFGVSIVTSALQALILPGEDEEKIRSLYEQSLPILQASKDKGWLGMILASQGDLWLHQPNGEEHAKTLYKQSLRLWDDMRKVDQGIGIVKALAGIAEMAAAQGQAERAGRLFGVVDRMLPPVSEYRAEVDRRVAKARAQLDLQSFIAGWNVGRTMTEEQAVTDALKEPLVAAKLA
jgi:predicted ATPase